jgi:hypothetical protein
VTEGSVNTHVHVGDGLGGEVAVRVGITVGRGVFVGISLGVSAKTVLTVAPAVSMISTSLIVGVDWKLQQDASIPAARHKGLIMFCRRCSFCPSL